MSIPLIFGPLDLPWLGVTVAVAMLAGGVVGWNVTEAQEQWRHERRSQF